MPKGHYSSSSRIFERRGDPWLSDKEQVRDYDRQPETENPDFDYDHRFHHSQNARGKPKSVPPRPNEINVVRKQEETKEPDFARRGANILHKLHRETRSASVEAKERPYRFKPCSGCRKALCASRGRCCFPLGRG